MAKKIRWGLVSTANINRRVIPALRASERGELVGISSRNRATGEAYAARWEIPRVFDGYEAMFASPDIDAVYISVPNHLHAPLSIAALEAGKAVLCEKPFALSLEEVDRVRETAARTGGVIAEAFMYRHHPQTKRIGEVVEGGRLGTLYSMRATFNFKINSPKNVRLVPDWGGGCLWDVGVYPISLAQYVMGAPPDVVLGRQWIGASGVDEHFVGQLHYKDGRAAQIICSFSSPWHTEAEILGSDGRLHVTRPFVGMEEAERRLTLIRADGGREEIPVPEEYLYQGEVEDIHDALLEGKPTYVTLEETRNHIHTALALYRSAAAGRPVELGELV